MELAAFILSLIALGIGFVTLPTAFQMFWGAPDLKPDTDVTHSDGATLLRFCIRNKMLQSRWLMRMHVHRESSHLNAHFRISEARTGKIEIPFRRARLQTERDAGKQVEIFPTIAPAMLLVGVHSKEGFLVVEQTEKLETGTALGPGQYCFEVEAITTHQQRYGWKVEFIVGTEPSGTYWSGTIKPSDFRKDN